MYAFEFAEAHGLHDIAWAFNNATREQAIEICERHNVPQETKQAMIDEWDNLAHIAPPELKTVFAIAGIPHLYDEFCATVRTRGDAILFIAKHNLNAVQAENIKIHWRKVKNATRQ